MFHVPNALPSGKNSTALTSAEESSCAPNVCLHSPSRRSHTLANPSHEPLTNIFGLAPAKVDSVMFGEQVMRRAGMRCRAKHRIREGNFRGYE